MGAARLVLRRRRAVAPGLALQSARPPLVPLRRLRAMAMVAPARRSAASARIRTGYRDASAVCISRAAQQACTSLATTGLSVRAACPQTQKRREPLQAAPFLFFNWWARQGSNL
jgi:hypothetical protein